MIDFALGIGIEVSEVVEFKIFTFEEYARDFTLAFVFAHEFEQDGAVTMEDGVNIFRCDKGDTSEVGVVVIFTPQGAKEAITSSAKVGVTYFTFSCWHNYYTL